MPVGGDDLLWQVEVEMPGWRSWRASPRRRLRRVLEADPDVVRLVAVTPILQRLLIRSFAPTVTIEVVADSPAAAHRDAKRIVERALAQVDRAGDANPCIVSTDGHRRPAPDN